MSKWVLLLLLVDMGFFSLLEYDSNGGTHQDPEGGRYAPPPLGFGIVSYKARMTLSLVCSKEVAVIFPKTGVVHWSRCNNKVIEQIRLQQLPGLHQPARER